MPVALTCCVVPRAKLAFAGVTAIEVNVAVVPVPLRLMLCGLLPALSVKLKVPVLVPVALGENVTDVPQLAPGPSVAGLSGQVDVDAKSLALLLMLVMVKAEARLLVSVTACDALVVPRACPAKLKLDGLTVTGRTPLPVRLTIGLTLALSEMVSVAARVPVTDGLKKTLTLQLAPAASVLGLSGQLLECV